MKYISTRGRAEPVDFVDACLAGLAPDGGLYVPEAWPQIEPARAGESYTDLAIRIVSAFAGDSISEDSIADICEKAYSSFSHRSVAPVRQTSPNRWMVELFHGPTLAFKDVAMQFIGRFYDHVLAERDERLTVICATSGDTGGAAAAAFAGSPRVDLVILHPDGRISPVQRKFMTSTGADNVMNAALEGDFDDCQAIVKGLFADTEFAEDVHLSGVNSINWARIAAQTVYYAYVQAALGPDRPLRFVVPSGNMGNGFAGYVAHKCGLLAGFDLICAVNENKSLATMLETGEMKRMPAVETPSPAMDISVPSNFERLVWDASHHDAASVRQMYDQYAQSQEAELPQDAMVELENVLLSARPVSNKATVQEMKKMLAETGELICPHTAVGTSVSRCLRATDACTIVVLATAHPAKFPETVKSATGRDAPLPDRCADIANRPEEFSVLAADQQVVRDWIRSGKARGE
ncbi:MAG: threonine synthase [Pseudomonadota bacterium]